MIKAEQLNINIKGIKMWDIMGKFRVIGTVVIFSSREEEQAERLTKNEMFGIYVKDMHAKYMQQARFACLRCAAGGHFVSARGSLRSPAVTID